MGLIYSDWTDPVIDDELRVADLIQSVKDLPPPPPTEQPETPTTGPTSTAQAEAKSAPTKSTGINTQKSLSGPSAGSSGRMNDTRASQIASELAALDNLMVLGLRGGGRATASVLDNGDLPTGMLDAMSASAAGVRFGNPSALNFGPGSGGVIQPGAQRQGLPTPASSTQAPTSAGTAAPVRKPVGNTTVSPPTVTGSPLPDAPTVVAGMRAGFRACYKRALDEDPTVRGSARITARVGANGEVTSASASGNLPGKLTSCLVARVRSAQFGAPEGGGATLIIPVLFEAQ